MTISVTQENLQEEKRTQRELGPRYKKSTIDRRTSIKQKTRKLNGRAKQREKEL